MAHVEKREAHDWGREAHVQKGEWCCDRPEFQGNLWGLPVHVM